MQDFIEMRIIEAVRELLTGKVNEILGDMQFAIPLIEFSDYRGGDVVVPAVVLSSCERNEKERIIRQDAYSVTITFSLPENEDSEFFCCAYGLAVGRAFELNPTLGGIADRAVINWKKYSQPKKPGCGENWEIAVSLRVTVEN